MAPHQMPQMPFLNPQQQRIDPRLANNPQPAMPLGSNIPLAPGPTAPGTGLSSADSISAVLATMTPQNVFDIIASMKVLAVNEPDKATALLNANPQLSYAIFQALIMMNMIEPTMLQAKQQQQLLAQVMALTPADIASLPEEQRANILKLRATLLGGA
ncbi:hypothetical protein BGX34_004613 [Mortierella sp. NVP85]|nr:hypothetical protein BGX34_004613 [Mortierella sp. NVP85]